MMIGTTNKERPNERVKIFSQNVQKNSVHVETILATKSNSYDIIFVQEPPFREIRKAPSAINVEGEAVTGAPMHPEWLYLVRPQKPHERPPRVMAYVSKRLAKLRPSMRFNLIDHPDILALSLTNGAEELLFLNIYNSDRNEGVMHLADCADDFPHQPV